MVGGCGQELMRKESGHARSRRSCHSRPDHARYALASADRPGHIRCSRTGRGDLVLLLGAKQTRTPFDWACLEGISDFLRGRGWIRVGANRDVRGDATALDGYLKRCIKRQTADYMAVVLERAGLVELDRERPARVRLRPQ
jgi:hypothetical protein